MNKHMLTGNGVVLALFSLGALAGLWTLATIPVSDGGQTLPAWDYWVNRYQTLIAGLAAVLGAIVLLITSRDNIAARQRLEERTRRAEELAFVRGVFLEINFISRNAIELLAHSTFRAEAAQEVQDRFQELRQQVRVSEWIPEGLGKTSTQYGMAIKSFYEAATRALQMAVDGHRPRAVRPAAFTAMIVTAALAEAIASAEEAGVLPERPTLTDTHIAEALAIKALADMHPSTIARSFMSAEASRQVDEAIDRFIPRPAPEDWVD